MNEFSDRPFMLGSLTGQRTWSVDRLGRLTATQTTYVWHPGENVAACTPLQPMTYRFSDWLTIPTFMTTQIAPTPQVIVSPAPAPKPVSPVKKAAHEVAQISCECGFYGYFDGWDNPYHSAAHIRGIIEAYGIVTVGSRGFRASKARIKALVIRPKWADAPEFRRVRNNYPDVPIFQRKRDALAEFPLTVPDDFPTPDTDPTFWTRDAS